MIEKDGVGSPKRAVFEGHNADGDHCSLSFDICGEIGYAIFAHTWNSIGNGITFDITSFHPYTVCSFALVLRACSQSYKTLSPPVQSLSERPRSKPNPAISGFSVPLRSRNMDDNFSTASTLVNREDAVARTRFEEVQHRPQPEVESGKRLVAEIARWFGIEQGEC